MITDIAALTASTRLQQRRLIEDFLKQRRALDGPFENMSDLEAKTLKTAMEDADKAAKSAVGSKRFPAHLKAVHWAALFRDTKYAVAGRKTLMAFGAHDAMLRAYRAGVESEKVGGV